MPFVSHVSKERVELQHQLIVALETNCSKCEFLKGKTPDSSYIYAVHGENSNQPAMLAFALYADCLTYAVYAPENLEEKQSGIFEFFMREVTKCAEAGEQIIVFSQKNYDAITKYNYGKIPINVKLYV